MMAMLSRTGICFFLFLLFLVISSCTPQPLVYKEPLKDEGELLLYLQPMPKEADRFFFTIEDVSFIREDDTGVPVSLSFNAIQGPSHVGVQKLLASGRVPHGPYKGVRMKVTRARMGGEAGEAELLAPEDPVSVPCFFEVPRGEVMSLFLGFDPLKSVTDGILFTPSFTLTAYGNELLSLAGYITSTPSNMVAVFNKKTMLMTGAISTGRAPAAIVLDQVRGQAYAAISGDDVIAVIDIVSGKIRGSIRLNSGDEPAYLALTPDGSTLLSVNRGSNTVSILDPRARFEAERLVVGEDPASVVIDPAGLRAYVMNSVSRSVSVVDLPGRMVFATIPVDGIPLRGAFSRKGDKLYVISRDIPDLSVIDTSGLDVTGKIFIGTGAISIKVDTRTDLIYVGNRTGGQISVVSPSASMFIDIINTGGAVTDMTIDNDENTLFALVPHRKVIQKFNLTNKKLIAELDTGEGASSVAVMGER